MRGRGRKGLGAPASRSLLVIRPPALPLLLRGPALLALLVVVVLIVVVVVLDVLVVLVVLLVVLLVARAALPPSDEAEQPREEAVLRRIEAKARLPEWPPAPLAVGFLLVVVVIVAAPVPAAVRIVP